MTTSSNTLIDHVYTNDLINKLTPVVIIDDITDHFPTFLRVSSSFIAGGLMCFMSSVPHLDKDMSSDFKFYLAVGPLLSWNDS